MRSPFGGSGVADGGYGENTVGVPGGKPFAPAELA
jgi:hypothetical protein